MYDRETYLVQIFLRFLLMIYQIIFSPDYFQSCSNPVKLKNAYLHCLTYADDVVLLSESAAGLQ